MIEVPVYRFDTDEVGRESVDETVFGDRVRMRLVRDAVVMYLANRRVGTHSTRTRSEVKGANRKPYRQKGTGRARAGTRLSPIWRGGGIVFGPKPRDYSYHLPKKARRQALRSAVLGKLRDGEVALLAGAKLEAPRTKAFARAFEALGVDGSALVVLPEGAEVLRKSARNLARTRVCSAGNLNAYEVVRHERLVLTVEGFSELAERLRPEGAAADAAEGSGPGED